VLNEVAEGEIQSSISGLRLIMDANYPKNDQSRAITNYPSEPERLTAQLPRVLHSQLPLLLISFTLYVLLKAVYDEFKLEIKRAGREIDWGHAELPIVPHYIFR
jgi:hypothetical protein